MKVYARSSTAIKDIANEVLLFKDSKFAFINRPLLTNNGTVWVVLTVLQQNKNSFYYPSWCFKTEKVAHKFISLARVKFEGLEVTDCLDFNAFFETTKI
jgi:hypothetical protein